MAEVLVSAGSINSGKIDKLSVQIYKLADRTISREDAISWLKDGHSLIPIVNGERLCALQLIELGDTETSYAIRDDNAHLSEDSLPDLPPV